MTDIFTAVETAIYSQLTSTAGTVLWGTRVYAGQARDQVTLPYVLFFNVSGGDDNDSPHRKISLTYQVEIWTAGSAAETQARQGSGYIDDAFHHQTLTVSGFTNHWCVCTSVISSVENVNGLVVYRRGRDVDIRLS